MGQKLVITLDETTTAKYLKLSQQRTTDEINSDCLPSGLTLTIDIAPEPFDSYVNCEGKEIGIASVKLANG